MAFAFVQGNSGVQNSNNSSPIAVSWPGSTTSGNFAWLLLGANATLGTVGVPSGWLSAPNGTTGSGPVLYAYYIANVGVRSGSESVTYTGTPSTLEMVLLEYSGAATSSPFDVQSSNSNSGSSTTPTSATFSTVNASELALVFYAQTNTASTTITFSAPTSSFNIRRQQAVSDTSSSRGALGVVDRSLSTTQTNLSTAVTSTKTGPWVSLAYTLKAPGAATVVFRKTLSGIGTGAGKRQTQGNG